VPFILREITGFLGSLVFTVMDLFWFPFFPAVLNETEILLDSPAFIGLPA